MVSGPGQGKPAKHPLCQAVGWCSLEHSSGSGRQEQTQDEGFCATITSAVHAGSLPLAGLPQDITCPRIHGEVTVGYECKMRTSCAYASYSFTTQVLALQSEGI